MKEQNFDFKKAKEIWYSLTDLRRAWLSEIFNRMGKRVSRRARKKDLTALRDRVFRGGR